MNKSDSIIELSKALSKFQGEVVQPKKMGNNPHFKSSFVTLDSLIESITNTSSKFGLSFLQFPLNMENKVGVKTIIMHDSGEWIEGDPIFVKPIKEDPQALGSVVTYLRRYSLASIFGMASELDDDAEAAMVRTEQNKNTYNKSSQQQGNVNDIPKNAEEASKLLFTFGKHNGKELGTVVKDDMQYLQWAAQNNKLPRNFIEGVKLLIAQNAQ